MNMLLNDPPHSCGFDSCGRHRQRLIGCFYRCGGVPSPKIGFPQWAKGKQPWARASNRDQTRSIPRVTAAAILQVRIQTA